MKRMVRPRIPFIATLVLFGLGIIAALILFVRQGSEHDRVLMEYQASQALNVLIERFVAGEELSLPPDVVGFGVYDEGGAALVAMGSAPEQLPGGAGTAPPNAQAIAQRLGTEQAQLQRGDLRLTRRTGGGPGRGGGVLPGERRGRGGESGTVQSGAPGRGVELDPVGAVTWLVEYSGRELTRARRLRITLIAFLGLVIGVLTVFAVRSETAIARAREEARRNEALAQLGAAARTITHEIKNPLAAIRLQTSLLRRLKVTGQPLDVIEEEVERLSTLVEEVRSFLSNPRGNPAIIDAGAAVHRIVGRLPYETAVRTDGTANTVWVDRLRFESIIVNLCNNAHQAMAAEGEGEGTPVEVSVTALSSSGDGSASQRTGSDLSMSWVRITVADRGPGIPVSLRTAVFDPFFTTRGSGTGIGLATVKAITEAAGGSVTIQNRSGGGAEISIILPAHKEDEHR